MVIRRERAGERFLISQSLSIYISLSAPPVVSRGRFEIYDFFVMMNTMGTGGGWYNRVSLYAAMTNSLDVREEDIQADVTSTTLKLM